MFEKAGIALIFPHILFIVLHWHIYFRIFFRKYFAYTSSFATTKSGNMNIRAFHQFNTKCLSCRLNLINPAPNIIIGTDNGKVRSLLSKHYLDFKTFFTISYENGLTLPIQCTKSHIVCEFILHNVDPSHVFATYKIQHSI